MRKNRIDIVVDAAKGYLKKSPRDPAHDLQHHERVWKNCLLIIRKEKIKLRKDLLKLACYWHDVSFKAGWDKDNVKKNSNHLQKYLPGLGFSKEEIRIAVLTVLHHEFLDIPKTVEGMVFQDADKIDVPSIERTISTYQKYKQGKISKDDIKSYFNTGLKWLPILSATMYFETSRKLTDKKVKEIIESETLKEIANDIGMLSESMKLKEEMSSKKVREKRAELHKRVENIKRVLLNE